MLRVSQNFSIFHPCFSCFLIIMTLYYPVLRSITVIADKLDFTVTVQIIINVNSSYDLFYWAYHFQHIIFLLESLNSWNTYKFIWREESHFVFFTKYFWKYVSMLECYWWYSEICICLSVVVCDFQWFYILYALI